MSVTVVMIEILFKAKRKNWKKLPKEKWWIEGAVLQSDNRAYIATSFVSGAEDEPLMVAAYEVIPETICQYTGLTDKNGTVIWENDILKYSYDYEGSIWLKGGEPVKYSIGAVFWQEWRGTWAVCGHEKSQMTNQDIYVYNRNPNRTEVIGNIFDNLDLLA